MMGNTRSLFWSLFFSCIMCIPFHPLFLRSTDAYPSAHTGCPADQAYCGFCQLGCSWGGKQTTLATHLADARDAVVPALLDSPSASGTTGTGTPSASTSASASASTHPRAGQPCGARFIVRAHVDRVLFDAQTGAAVGVQV